VGQLPTGERSAGELPAGELSAGAELEVAFREGIPVFRVVPGSVGG
jgi:hypothetical protein